MKSNFLFNFLKVFYFTPVVSLLFFISCEGDINSIEHTAFENDGDLKKEIRNSFYWVSAPNKIQFYVEASGSMNGVFRAKKSTRFKTDMWNFISKYNQISDVNLFVDGQSSVKTLSKEDFRNQMNNGALTSAKNTIVPDMIKKMLSDVDAGSAEVSILVSDMKYSPPGQSETALSQYQVDVRNLFNNKDYGVCILGFESEFLKVNGTVDCPEFPYYFIVVGKKEKVAWVRNEVMQTLSSSLKGYLDFNVSYGIPAYSALPSLAIGMMANIYQTDKETGCYSFTDYNTADSSAEMIVALNYNHLPPDVLPKIGNASFTCKTFTGNSEITYEVLKNYSPTLDGSIRSAIRPDLYMKVTLTNMKTDCEVISLNLNTMPQADIWIRKYYGAVREAENDKTLSMDHFVNGLKEAYPTYEYQTQPVYFLVSKKRI